MVNKVNLSVHKITQSVFSEWFIHFHHKNAKSFELVDSKLGMIPRGWEVKKLSEVANLIDCLHTKKPSEKKKGKLLLQAYNVGKLGLLDLSHKYWISDGDFNQWTRNILLKQGDCVISNAGKVGEVAQIPENMVAGIGRNLTAIRPIEVTPTYLIEYLLSPYGKQQIYSQMDPGTVLDSLNVRGIKRMLVLVPPKESKLMEKFEEFARPFREYMELNS